MKNMVIAVEGMDGVGKTLISKYISEKFSFIYVDKPTKYLFLDKNDEIEYQKFYKELEKVYKSDEKYRSEFFGQGNAIAVKKFEGQNIVIDRHIVSNYYWNGNKCLKNYYKKLISICGKPDLTIYLHASNNIRMERLKNRNPDDKDLYDETIFIDGIDKCVSFMDEFNFKYVIINTDNLSKEEVFLEVDNVIKTYTEKER